MDLNSIVWTLGVVASLVAIAGVIASILKWGIKKTPINNGLPQTRVRPKRLVSNNLPSLQSIGNLVGEGRKRKQVEIINAINQHRLVVLEAIGGIGKSTLARNVAEQIIQNNGKKYDAVVWISAKDTDVNLDSAIKTIAYVLDYHQYISMQDNVDLRKTAILEKLQEKNVFFVFDNFETITDNEFRKFIEVIPDNNRILVTTRHDVERISHDQFSPDIEKLDFNDGREVILHELKRQGLLKHSTDEIISRIYGFTDGLPQAIIWAISQLKYSTISSIEEVALSGHGDVFENLFKLSWDMLDDPHKEILKAMLFFTKPVASKALKTSSSLLDRGFTDAMSKLVGLSIIDANQEIDEESKFYSMHSWSQHFSRLKLNYNNDDAIFTAKNLGHYYVSFCEIRYGKNKGVKGYDEIEYELPNIIKTMKLLETHEESKETNLLIINFAKTINVFLWSRGFWYERILVCKMALRAAKRLSKEADIDKKAHYYSEAGIQAYYIGIVNFWQSKYKDAAEWADLSLDYMKKSNNKLKIMLAKRLLALISMSKGEVNAVNKFIEVLNVLREYREISQESVAAFADWIVLSDKGYLVGEVSLLQEIGICYYRHQKYSEAKKSLLDSKKLALEINDEEGLAVSLSHLGHVYYGLEDYSEAKHCYTQGLLLAEKVRRKSTIARCCEGLTKIFDNKNRRKQIEKYGLRALDVFDKLNMTEEYDQISSILSRRNIRLKK